MKKKPLYSFFAPRYWLTWVGLVILRLFSFLPLPVLAFIGQGIGMLAYVLIGSRRKIAFKNISVCFPERSEEECRRINRAHFRLVGQSLFSVTMNFWISKKRFNRLVEVTGREYYDEALDAGCNIILLAPHFIALDVGGYTLAPERPMITMYQYSKNQLIDEIVKRGRVRFGGLLVERKEPLKKLIRLLRQGYLFYYLPDQDAGRKGIFVPFFHELAATIPMLGKFASLTNAVVIPCQTRIKPWGQGYEVILGKPIENFPQGNDEVDTTKMNEVIANMIGKMPEQYFWVHKRFKTRPQSDGADTKFYN